MTAAFTDPSIEQMIADIRRDSVESHPGIGQTAEHIKRAWLTTMPGMQYMAEVLLNERVPEGHDDSEIAVMHEQIRALLVLVLGDPGFLGRFRDALRRGEVG